MRETPPANQEWKEDDATQIPTSGITLAADLLIPEGASGLVVFAHGSGSSRFSPRNRLVAEQLRAGGLGTCLMDLLTSREEEIDIRTRHLRFDIELLSQRVVGVIDWLHEQPKTRDLAIGTFGSSTGAAAALVAAARRPEIVQAVVSRGGRPDLASEVLDHVQAPTLLIVGGNDTEVIRLNKQAQAKLTGKTELELIAGAGHLFQGPGELKQVAQLAREWFLEHLVSHDPA